MADEGTGKIYIIVTNKLPGGSSGEAAIATEAKSEESTRDNSLLKHYAMNKFISTVENTTRNAINFGLNNIGNFTGNYILQQQISDTRMFLNSLAGIGMAAWAGFKASGSGWGALIGAGVEIMNQTISKIESLSLINLQQRQTNYNIAQIRERSGLNGKIDGSRGTEN